MCNKEKSFIQSAFSGLLLFPACLISIWILSCRIVYVFEQSYCAPRSAAFVFLASALLLLILYFPVSKLLHPGEKTFVCSEYIAFISTYALTIYIDTNNSLIWAVIFLLLSYMVNRAVAVRSHRAVYSASVILGVIFALFVFLGFQLKKYGRLEFLYIYENYEMFCLSLGQYFLIFAGFSCLFTVLLLLLFSSVSDGSPQATPEKKPKGKYSVVLLSALFFIAVWSVYYVAFFPGIISADSLEEIRCQLGLRQIKDGSPLMHQWLILLCLKVGQWFDSLRLGVGIYSALQLLLLALSFGVAVSFMYEIKAPRLLTVGMILLYAFFPVNAFYSVTMWKNVPFAISVVLLITSLFSEAVADDHGSRGTNPVILVIVSFFFSTMQKNGFAVFLIGFALFFLLCGYSPKRKRKMSVVYISVIILFICYRLIVNCMDVEKGKIGEALSVPIQQIARVVNKVGTDEDCAEDFITLSEVFSDNDMEQLGSKYKSYISDPVKEEGVFLSSEFLKDPMKYAKCWLRIGLRHPLIYLEAFLLQNYGYWYPDVQYWIVVDTIDRNSIGLSFSENSGALRHSLYELFKTYSQQEPLTILFSLGFAVWICIVCGVVLILKHQKKYAAPMILLLILWVTTLGAPVFCEYRYLYGLVICVPVVVVSAWMIPCKK